MDSKEDLLSKIKSLLPPAPNKITAAKLDMSLSKNTAKI